VPEQRKWFDQTQPQTLQAAVLFSYINAGLAFLSLLIAGLGPWVLLIVAAVGANGIANEKRWGYRLAAACALLYLVSQLALFWWLPFAFSTILNLVFAGVLVGLIFHPQSREYERIWFH
jgi:hypothetical protein